MSTTYVVNARTLGVSRYEGEYASAVEVAHVLGERVLVTGTSLRVQDAQGTERVRWRLMTGKMHLLEREHGTLAGLALLGWSGGEMQVIVRANSYGSEVEQVHSFGRTSTEEIMGMVLRLARDLAADAWQLELTGEGAAEIESLRCLMADWKRQWH